MEVLKKEWKVFIKEMNKTGDKIASYLKAYPKCKSRASARVNASKLLHNATVVGLLKQTPVIQQEARSLAINELKDEIKFDALTVSEKREYLRRLAFGEVDIEEHFVKRDGTVGKYFRKPSAFERMKAIEIDNRMAGDDAPEKHIVVNVTNIADLYKQALSMNDQYKNQGLTKKKMLCL